LSAINTLLAVRSHFSIGESTLLPETIAKLAKSSGTPDVVICDTMTVNAIAECAKLTSDTFAPRFGVTLKLVDDLSLKDKKVRQPSYNLKVYPRDAEAMRAMFALLSLAHTEENYFDGPRLSFTDIYPVLRKFKFAVSTGDLNGIFEHADHMEIMEQLLSAVGNSCLWVELCPVSSGYHDRLNKIAFEYLEAGARPLVTVPVLYAPGGYDPFVVQMAIHGRSTVTRDFTMKRPSVKDQSLLNTAEFVANLRLASARLDKLTGTTTGNYWRLGITNQKEFLSQLEYKWVPAEISLPKLADDSDVRLRELCAEGLRKRMSGAVFGEKIDPALVKDVYMPRLKYELGVLKDMGFAGYFLVVDDLVRWCKANGILVGPGRGSVGGSLVAYAMGITDVDPIRFGLIFERFINPSRRDLPDIDLDFMSTRRQEVIDYLIERYGADHVSGISNYTVLGSASGMKDVGRVFGLDVMKTSASKFVPKVHGQPVNLAVAAKEVAEIGIFADDYPEVWRNAVALQGVMRSYGKHASGIVVAGRPVSEMGVVERRSGELTVNWDMRIAEQMGLVKLDILGLSTLDTISRTLDHIKRRHGAAPDILSIPLDDKDTLAAFSVGMTVGVFQFEGGAARRILKDMSKVADVTFEDIVAANALNRPGPIDAGLVEKYVDAKNGEIVNELPHENMREALDPTYNVIVYQEQVMKVAVDLCGFTLADADGLRKAMGKKDAKIMAKYKDQFVDGAQSFSGMDPKMAGSLFEQIEVFAGYAFNKSHAAEYSLISYQCMWLKCHYPVEFYAGAFSTVKEDRLKPLLLDALESGITILPPDINVSEADFVILDDTTLVTPFNRVKRASDKATNAIMVVRATGGHISSIDNLKKRLTEQKLGRYCNKAVIENLNLCGAFANVEPGQAPPNDESRIKDKLLLMPGLVTQVMRTDRMIPNDRITLAQIGGIIKGYSRKDEDAVNVLPVMGSKPSFMVVADCPSWSEEAAKKFAEGRSFEYIAAAMREAGLSKKDAYWTALLKVPKSGRQISQDEIKVYSPFLAMEIELLKPQLIVTLGSASSRYFVPDLRGSILEHTGATHYLPKIDATVLIGFNPAMIFHDPARGEDLAELFKTVKGIIS
jgi:DNA polymerase-3 subunit alpha